MNSRKLKWSSVNNSQLQAFVPHNPSIMNSCPVSVAASQLEIYSSSSCHPMRKKKEKKKGGCMRWGRLWLCWLVLGDREEWKLQSEMPQCTDLVWLLSHSGGPPVAIFLCHRRLLILHVPQQRVSVCRRTGMKLCDSTSWWVSPALMV